MNIEQIRNAFVSGASVEYRAHCLKRMMERDISRKDVENCIMKVEIIEDYHLDEFNLSTESYPSCEYKECIIVIKNVPCLECEICGEITFSDEVSEKLELLVNTAKKLMQDISVIDYCKVA